MENRVLITGVYGLIGNIVFRRLRSDHSRFKIRGTTRRRAGSARVLGGTLAQLSEEDLVVADVSNLEAMTEACAGVDTVVHMAANPDREATWESLLQSNVIGARSVLEAARIQGVRRVIFASSIQVCFGYREVEPYLAIHEGRHADIPNPIPLIDADAPTWPTSVYASSKVWGESLCRTYSHLYGLSCICLRIGWVTEDDRPRHPRTWYQYCSHRDIAELVVRCIEAPDDVGFEIFYGVSDNRYRWVDIERAKSVVGYVPRDSDDGGGKDETGG